ncbi:MAG: hypothetical protein LBN39_08025 [Planctomycetaceae bacterium]|nr:hypothetical protein [Planctomycetaceae bacterium]
MSGSFHPFLFSSLPALFFLVFVCCIFLQTAAADALPVNIAVGIDGAYKNGLWTPVRVLAPAARSGLSLTCSDGDGVPVSYRFPDDSGNLSPLMYIKLGRADEPVRIQQGQAPAVSVIPPPPIAAEKPIYLLIGNDDIGLQGAVAELALKEDRRPVIVKIKSFKELPDQWFGYEAIDTVFLTTTEPEQFAGLTADSPQIQALDQWVKMGGQLVLAAGEKFNTSLSAFLPGKFEKFTELRDGKALESFIGSKRKIFMNGTDEAPYLKMPRFEQDTVKGVVLAKESDLPLAVRTAHGFGIVIYFGSDLSGRPLSVWRDRTELVKELLQWNAEKKNTAVKSGALIQLGYNDITGQVRSALDKFDSVWILPFSVVLLILAAYWILVGAGDWLLVKKQLKRPHLTWFTFPLMLVLFCVLAYCLTAIGHPNRVMVNELQLVDYDSETGGQRITTWQNLYSPKDARYSMENRGLFLWDGLPGSGFGGMAPKTVSPTLWQTGYEQTLSNVPVAVRSTKSFFGQNWHNGQDCANPAFTVPVFTADIADEEGVPVGTLKLTNPPNLPQAADADIELNYVQLIYGRWALELGTVKPGQEITVGKKTRRKELRELLLPPEVLKDEALKRLGAYNPQAADLDYIARVLSLHGALGGRESVGLDNTFRRSLDMSGLLTADRAILLGKINGKKEERQPFSIFRQSLPIRLTALSPRLRIEKVELKKDDIDVIDRTIGAPERGGYEPGK